ncbi:hypothetical protein D4764_21G0000630 [Takifugu flavidus]|uniref:Reverse transcriptase domain-containing protein n=1 Tax=Takifugu flavidus TaxID=433684 RepID=A0A5C6ND97_9TELE|nr:hypothetical protein D4764_21G0000630 [Takifugu flavidus]
MCKQCAIAQAHSLEGTLGWTLYHSGVADAADQCCGRKVRDAVRLKKESYRALLARGTPEAADRYRQAKWSAATAVAEAKTQALEEFGEAMENDLRTASKRFWTTIRRLRRGKQCTVSTVYSGDGVLLTSTRDVVDRWKEYFKDLLNPTNAPSSEEVGPGDLGIGSHISGAEVAETSGAVPLDWQTGVVVPLFKKGDRRVCSNFRGITLLSLPVDQLYTLSRVFEGAWEFAQLVHMCFVDLKKAFDRVLWGVLWGVLREYGVSGPLILAVRSLYDWCQSLVRIAGSGVPSPVKEEILPQVEEFKYLGVLFTSEGRMQQEIDRQIGVASAVMWTLHRSVVVKREPSQKAKLSIYRSIFVATLTYGHELWVMTERTRSRVQAAKMSFLRRVAGLSLRDRVRSSAIWKELGVEPLLLRVERSQMRWLGHLVRMPPGRLPGEVLGHVPPVGDPWEDPGHVGETVSLDWSGNAWGSLWMSWKR